MDNKLTIFCQKHKILTKLLNDAEIIFAKMLLTDHKTNEIQKLLAIYQTNYKSFVEQYNIEGIDLYVNHDIVSGDDIDSIMDSFFKSLYEDRPRGTKKIGICALASIGAQDKCLISDDGKGNDLKGLENCNIC